MADDGMLMNFAVNSDPLQAKPVFKGGRWKARLQAKKGSQRRQEKHGALTGSNAVPTKSREPQLEVQETRPAKRQKLAYSNDTRHQTHDRITKPAEVVSSLFTYNPKAKATTSVGTDSKEDVVPDPSNAPLPAHSSPFASLGLSTFLSTHLTQSLGLAAPTAIQKSAITQLLQEDSDAFIQAETGSGKTLAYLLPIVQRLTLLAKEKKLDRSSGLFALILAPTRELTHQISAVLTRLLRPLPYLVAGTVTGGSTKNHEKSRLRKGLNILIATPGRLADHLEHTKSLDVTSIRWLVLDEGDRLMELGFEEDIKAIVKQLDRRKSEKDDETGANKIISGLPARRTTVLCSATMKMGVQKLGEISLKDAVHIKADPTASQTQDLDRQGGDKSGKDREKTFLAPAQLRQSYLLTPPKQRLVTLAAQLKRTFARKGSIMKAIVFLSCADSVDFHFDIFTRRSNQSKQEHTNSDQDVTRHVEKHHSKNKHTSSDRPSTETNSKSIKMSGKHGEELPTVASATQLVSSGNPDLTVYKLHGSLEQKTRTATLQAFARSTDPDILLCTDVASRGLDLPNVDLVIEYDPPFSADDHLHRVGRTARAGKEGRSCCFLMPGEEEGYVSVLRDCAGNSSVRSEDAEEVLKKGFVDSKGVVDKSNKWNDRATEWQLDVERWVIENKRAGEMARKAFISHVRAYATHVAVERSMFDVKALHLGHLAKAFALRERPGNMGRSEIIGGRGKTMSAKGHGEKRRFRKDNVDNDVNNHGLVDASSSANNQQDAARMMRAKMKEHMSNAGEFNIG